jgi:limonene 1,2-monooxygenase
MAQRLEMKTMYSDMRFGMFIPPFHGNDENPTLALERDIALVQHLDELDYHEVWLGEHHSSGFEIIAAPDLMIAAAAERTKHIRMGTGVSSLSFHHPFLLAERMVQLDHQTRGRIMFGVGPGQLPGDAFMLGISPVEQRRMTGESLEAMLALLRGETVSRETDWFRLRDARLQILPYQHPMMEVATAAVVTPSGPTNAGKHGISMLSLAAGTPEGFAVLKDQWQICETAAAEAGKTVSRRNWRVVVAVHVAHTAEQALHEVEHNMLSKLEYFRRVSGRNTSAHLNLGPYSSAAEAVRAWVTDDGTSHSGLGPFGIGIVGSPQQVAHRIQLFQPRAGGFGCLLLLAHNLASWDATKRSLELFARQVIPILRGTNRNRVASLDWSETHADTFAEKREAGYRRATEDYQKTTAPKRP